MEGRKSSEYKKGLWTEEEDKILTDYIQLHGKGKWNRLAKHTGLKRCGKSCRLRWINYLSPNVNRGHFTKEEDDLIIRLHNLLGNRWALIAGRVPGRTDNQVKNHWNTHLCKIYGNKLKKGKARVGETLSSKSDCSGTKPDEVVQVVPEIDHGSGFEDYNDDYYGNDKALARFWAKFFDDKCMPGLLKCVMSRGQEQEEGIKESIECLKILEAELGDRKFFGGEEIGLVDIVANFLAFGFMIFQEVSGLEVLTDEKFPRLYKWTQEYVDHSVIKECLPARDYIAAYFTASLEASSN